MWDTGYNATITITNTSDSVIDNWCLTFPLNETISNIWNAVNAANIKGKYELSCESYNQNIAPGASVTFGFIFETGCSGKLMENVVLKEYVATDSAYDGSGDEEEGSEIETTKKVAIIFGMMEEDDSDELYLGMMVSFEIKSYEIYVSMDNGNFEMVAEIDEFDSREKLGLSKY